MIEKTMPRHGSEPASDGVVQSEWKTISVNGQPMEVYLSRPAHGQGALPAVIVLMEIFGVNSHIQALTGRFAENGYVAIAPNYYHRTTRNLELGYTDEDVRTGQQHKGETTREGILADMQGLIDFLKSLPEVSPKDKMGCIGFCFGGHAAYIAASLPEIAATAAFYPGGLTSASAGVVNHIEPTVTHASDIHGRILCLFGEEDTLIPHEDTVTVEQGLREAKVSYEVIRYAHTGHGFFCDQRASFNPSAAEDAWTRVQSLFAQTLK